MFRVFYSAFPIVCFWHESRFPALSLAVRCWHPRSPLKERIMCREHNQLRFQSPGTGQGAIPE